MSEENHVARVVPQSPDESLLDAIGNQHSLESALADLVDNAIESGGSLITVQLITTDSKLEKLRVIDNGRGMSSVQLEEAMQLRKKTYRLGSLSFFGMGMKMASLSQAATLRVFTKSEQGSVSGAQMRRKDAGGQFNTEILEEDFAKQEYSKFRRTIPGSGTVVEWQKIDDVSIAKKQRDRDSWLNEKVKSINRHFGLVFHRFLERGTIKLFVEIWDATTQEVGSRTPSSPLDPFLFRSPLQDYPATFYGKTPSKTRVELYCSIVPAGSESENVKIHGQPLELLGGFFVYRHDRLVQVAGWQDLTHKKAKELQHGRIRIELTDELIDAGIKLTAEKTSIRFSDEIKKTILTSRSEKLNRTFEEYLQDIENIKKLGSKRNTGLQPSLRIEGAENWVLRNSVEKLIGFKSGSEHLEIVSVPLNEDQVFELDLENDELRINSLLFEEDGPLDSETGYEFFKATLYFLLESHFTKSTLNKNTLQKIEQMHRVLAIALGIQSLETDSSARPIVPTPAVIALLAPIQAPAKPSNVATSYVEINFQPVWSSVNSKSDTDTWRKLDKFKKIEPAEDEKEKQKNERPKGNSKSEKERSIFETNSVLAKLGLDVLKEYKKSHDVASVASALRKPENEITAVLAQLVLQFVGALDNRDEAFLAGEPFSSSERDRVLSKFRDGQDIARLSMETGRTSLQIAREILDAPSFQAKISSSLLKKLGEVAESANLSE